MMNNSSAVQFEKKVDEYITEITVSVIIATYRRDVALKRALESIINQTYDSTEIVVIDDNADINWNVRVKSIIEELSLSHSIIYIKNNVNKGSAETRNIGIKKATGQYITFLDDDDVYLPNKIINQLDNMIQNNSDYSITDLELYDENERFVEKRTRKYIKKYTKDGLLRYHLMYHITGTDSLMFKKDYLLKIGGFPPINIGDEFYLMQKAIEAGGKFSYLPTCDIKAYIHTGTNGLSSGGGKIDGENMLYEHKKKYFDIISYQDKQYIAMRHYAVLAFAEMRRKNYRKSIKYSIKSFFKSPIHSLKLFLRLG